MSYIPQIQNFISVLNSTSTPLASGATFQGVGEDVSKYGRAGISIFTPFGQSTSGTLTIEVSRDNVNWGGPDREFADTATAEPHMWNIVEQYFRIKYVNNSATASTFQIQVQYSVNSDILLGHQLDDTIIGSSEAIITRSILVGKTDGGTYKNVPITQEGHLETEIHGPLLPFGSLHTESLIPQFQIDAVYGVNALNTISTSSLGGSVTSDDRLLICGTGTALYAQGSLQTRKRLKYKAGQGSVLRYSAWFTTPVAYSYQVAGLGHSEDGVYFGYKEVTGGTPSFGVLYVNRGVREIQTLTLSAASTTNENITIRLGNSIGVPNNNTIAVTNSANITRTAWEISQGTYAGWNAYPSGNTVVFVCGSAGNVTGTFGITATTAGGSFVETRSGATSTEQFIPQSEWNGDRLDGSGNDNNGSGVLLDPTKGNVYQIGLQYLGAGAINFDIEAASADGNNADWVTAHTLKLPNSMLTTSFSNPSMPFTMAAYSAGSTADLKVKVGSVGGFTEGPIITTGNRFTFDNTRAGYITNGSIKPFYTILNPLTYKGVTSQLVITLISIGANLEDSATNGTIYLIKNGTLVGNPNFVSYSTNSAVLQDTAATTVTYTDNSQIIFSLPIALHSSIFTDFASSITLQPGEYLTVGARADSTTIDYMSVSLNIREE